MNLFIGDIYNRYTCPLQPCTHLTLKLLIQGHPQSAEVAHIADFKSAYISLIIKAATILRLLGNETIQSNTRVKKSEPGVRKQLKIDVKSTTKLDFIALIHPIQWTIALPVGATSPAKRQKKTSCI